MGLIWRLLALVSVAGVLLAVRYVIAVTDPTRHATWTKGDRDTYHDAEHDAWYRS